MLRNGIPEENIILMAYDDIANSIRNPFPGQVFNQPDGSDVYAGVKIDYSGEDVTPDNFLAVLRGDSVATRGKKVLQSDSNSKVFINFVDHGATGLVAFPSEILYADDLVDALVYMNDNSMYDQLVFYLEACESGSMFSGLLPSNINIYATTAANGIESSYAEYCSPQDKVQGVHIGSCLGDLYSVIWMEDTDAQDVSVETLATQFTTVKTQTSLSHVMEYGTTAFKNEVIGDFQGDLDLPAAGFFKRMVQHAQTNPMERGKFAVSSRDAKLASLYGQVLYNPSTGAHLELQEELTHRMKMDHIWETILGSTPDFTQDFPEPRNFACLKSLVNTYRQHCETMLSDYSLKYVKFLVAECEKPNSEQFVHALTHKIANTCAK